MTPEQIEALRVKARAEVAKWPPLTPELRQRVAEIFGVEARLSRTGPSEYELEQRRKAQERADALKAAQQAALALTACDVCNLQPDQHVYAQRRSIDSHEWQPGRAEKIMGQQRG